MAHLLTDRSLANARDRYGSTVVMYAALYGDVALLRLVWEHGGDLNAADQSGANVQTIAANGDTAVQLASKRGPTKVAALLDSSSPRRPPLSSGESSSPVTPTAVRAAAEKGLALLQKCVPEFFRKSGCVACHQQSVTSHRRGEQGGFLISARRPVAMGICWRRRFRGGHREGIRRSGCDGG